MKEEIFQDFLKNDFQDGWFYNGDMVSIGVLGKIQNNGGIKGDIVEIGVYKGKSFSFFSHLIKDNEKLFGYDLFEENNYEATQLSMENYGAKVDYELIKTNTSDLDISDIKNKIKNCNIRFLHIDAGHEYFEVLHSLRLFSPFVKDTGIIVMDDYQDPEFPGIEAAVLDFCEIDRPRRFIPFFSGQNKIYLTTKFNSNLYQKLMITNDNFKNKSRLSIVRDFSILKGFSKLPTKNDELIEQIDEFDSNYLQINSKDITDCKIRAKYFSQLKFGNSKYINEISKKDT